MALRSLSLFSGVGGLDLGVEPLGGGIVPACYVERDAHAAAVLVARMADGGLAPAPVWSDVSTFDARPFRGLVDAVVGGFPCTDVSGAGKRAGVRGGARSGLWSQFDRIVGECDAGLVFVENVRDLAGRGLDIVLGDLAARGFDAEWDCVPASIVGASQPRERIFLLAYRSRERLAAFRSAHHRDGSDAPRDLANRRRQGVVPFPPGPDLDARPDLEPLVAGGDDGPTSWVDRARACGNGVIPLHAEHTFRRLIERALA